MSDDLQVRGDAIEKHLREASILLPQTVDLQPFHNLLDEGEFEQAFLHLKELTLLHAVPMQFWFKLSRAGDLLGGPFAK